mmetsp:Transcript_20469/g.65339  ORF Transcript_20469/g.65339 Transcript_20469/m.65339 type:complete len:309 (-) Transcript_20469:847-1773(-)
MIEITSSFSSASSPATPPLSFGLASTIALPPLPAPRPRRGSSRRRTRWLNGRAIMTSVSSDSRGVRRRSKEVSPRALAVRCNSFAPRSFLTRSYAVTRDSLACSRLSTNVSRLMGMLRMSAGRRILILLWRCLRPACTFSKMSASWSKRSLRCCICARTASRESSVSSTRFRVATPRLCAPLKRSSLMVWVSRWIVFWRSSMDLAFSATSSLSCFWASAWFRILLVISFTSCTPLSRIILANPASKWSSLASFSESSRMGFATAMTTSICRSASALPGSPWRGVRKPCSWPTPEPSCGSWPMVLLTWP